jgi:hypothetical protein
MKLKQLLLGGALATGLAASAAVPALADWDDHGHGGGYDHGGYDHGGGWGGHGHWDGHPYNDWHGRGWWDGGHRWHWYAGWGPAYGYVGPVPVWGPGVPVYAAPPPGYYAPYAPPPPPPVYYAPPPPPPVYVAPPPAILITPRGIGITP